MGTEESLNTIHQPPLQRRGGEQNRRGARRARAACALCRWRKVRCDVGDRHPCSNCAFEEIQCVLTQRQQRRTNGSPKVDLPATMMATRRRGSPVGFGSSSDLSQGTQEGQISLSLQAETQNQRCSPNLLSYLETYETTNRSSQPCIDLPVASAQRLPASSVPLDSSLSVPVNTQILSTTKRSLTSTSTPPYVKPLPLYLGIDDAEYLCKKGALSVPETELRDALLRSYITFVHPILPILDIRTFQASLENPDQAGQLSFPLFQAVMFAGAAWVDVKLVRKLGYLTRKAARKALYQKARLLYDSDYEEDRLCLVQTLLLLTLWWEGPHEQKDGWYWSGLSLSVARTTGLNRDHAGLNLNPSSQRLRRRIWWACLMRDTFAAFGLNRAPRIKDADYEVSMLTMEDFEIQEPQSQATPWTVAKDAGQQRQLATVCIEMAKLCRLISKILVVAYPEGPAGETETLYSNQEIDDANTALPPRRATDSWKLKIYEDELQNWRNTVPNEALHIQPTPSPSEPLQQAPVLFRGLVSLLYFTALLSIHRPTGLASSKRTALADHGDGKQEKASREIVRRAAAHSTEIVMDLYRSDLVRLLPATGISCLIPVSISHISDMKSPDEITKREGQQGLNQCKQVLQDLSDAHIAAEWAVNFLGFVASQVRRKGTEHRRPAGMVSGEIKWNAQAAYSPLVLPRTTLSLSSVIEQTWCKSGSSDHQTAGTAAPAQLDTRAQEQQETQHDSVTEGFGTDAIMGLNNLAQSPNGFSNSINFPEMWLDMAAASDSMLDMDWTGSNQMPTGLE